MIGVVGLCAAPGRSHRPNAFTRHGLRLRYSKGGVHVMLMARDLGFEFLRCRSRDRRQTRRPATDEFFRFIGGVWCRSAPGDGGDRPEASRAFVPMHWHRRLVQWLIGKVNVERSTLRLHCGAVQWTRVGWSRESAPRSTGGDPAVDLRRPVDGTMISKGTFIHKVTIRRRRDEI